MLEVFFARLFEYVFHNVRTFLYHFGQAFLVYFLPNFFGAQKIFAKLLDVQIVYDSAIAEVRPQSESSGTNNSDFTLYSTKRVYTHIPNM